MAEYITTKSCPKCGSKNFTLTEICEMEILYNCTNSMVEPIGRGDDGKLISRRCDCNECGYSWSPRGPVLLRTE